MPGAEIDEFYVMCVVRPRSRKKKPEKTLFGVA